MTRLIIASQLPSELNRKMFGSIETVDVLTVRPEDPSLPRGAKVLIAAPPAVGFGVLPAEPPAGWPFDLQWIHLPSAGIDGYPSWLLSGSRAVTTSRGATAPALAEFALAAMLAAAKRLPEIWLSKDSSWRPLPHSMLEGQTLGILGLGAIGSALARKALALGVNVLATRRSQQPLGIDGVVRARDASELFARADHLLISAPLTRETHHIVNRSLLANAKKGLHLINLARGELIDDDALLEALDEDRIGLATLDATHPEPLPAGHPYYGHPRVHLSAHSGSMVPESLTRGAAQFAANVARFLRGEQLDNLADFARGY